MNIDPEAVIILKETTFLWMNKFRYVCGKNKQTHTPRHDVIVKWHFIIPRNSCMDKLYVLRTAASKRHGQCINSRFTNSLEAKL